MRLIKRSMRIVIKMPNTLFVRPSHLNGQTPSHEKIYEWALYDIVGSLLKYGTKTSLGIIDQTLMQNGLDQVDIVGLFPAYAALSTEVGVPGNQTRYVQQALPFAVEEQIAQDIDEMHLILGDKNKTSEFRVIGIGHTLFSGLFNDLNNEELVGSLKAIYLDSDLIDLEQNALKIVLSSNEAFVLAHNRQAISMHNRNLIAYLDALFLAPKEGEPRADLNVTVVLDKTSVDSSKMLLAQIEQYPHVNVSIEELSTTAFEYVCSQFFQLNKLPLNLCQGMYQVRSKSQGVWARWRAVALIAGLGFLLQLGMFVGEGLYLNNQAVQISESALAEYKKAVPGTKNISVAKLPRIIKGQLNQLKTGGVEKLEFLDLLGEAGNKFNASPYKSSLIFNSINYSEQRGELMLEMHAKSFEQLEALKKAIVDSGMNAKISSAAQEKDYFKGRISIGGV
jgi:general secretion pathway protein L